ncbi:hypothetical protein ACFL2K_00005, partial [Candidatus Margulisiibacteriota bacterium]
MFYNITQNIKMSIPNELIPTIIGKKIKQDNNSLIIDIKRKRKKINLVSNNLPIFFYNYEEKIKYLLYENYCKNLVQSINNRNEREFIANNPFPIDLPKFVLDNIEILFKSRDFETSKQLLLVLKTILIHSNIKIIESHLKKISSIMQFQFLKKLSLNDKEIINCIQSLCNNCKIMAYLFNFHNLLNTQNKVKFNKFISKNPIPKQVIVSAIGLVKNKIKEKDKLCNNYLELLYRLVFCCKNQTLIDRRDNTEDILDQLWQINIENIDDFLLKDRVSIYFSYIALDLLSANRLKDILLQNQFHVIENASKLSEIHEKDSQKYKYHYKKFVNIYITHFENKLPFKKTRGRYTFNQAFNDYLSILETYWEISNKKEKNGFCLSEKEQKIIIKKLKNKNHKINNEQHYVKDVNNYFHEYFCRREDSAFKCVKYLFKKIKKSKKDLQIDFAYKLNEKIEKSIKENYFKNPFLLNRIIKFSKLFQPYIFNTLDLVDFEKKYSFRFLHYLFRIIPKKITDIQNNIYSIKDLTKERDWLLKD